MCRWAPDDTRLRQGPALPSADALLCPPPRCPSATTRWDGAGRGTAQLGRRRLGPHVPAHGGARERTPRGCRRVARGHPAAWPGPAVGAGGDPVTTFLTAAPSDGRKCKEAKTCESRDPQHSPARFPLFKRAHVGAACAAASEPRVRPRWSRACSLSTPSRSPSPSPSDTSPVAAHATG